MPTITVARVATQFLERNQLEKPTRTTYEFALAPFLQKYGYWSIFTLDRSEIKDYLDSLKGIKYTTHNKIQRVLNALFNYALSEGYIDANPMQRLPKRKPDREKGEHRSDEVVRYLTPEQLDILYQVVDNNPRLAAIVSLLHRTGARIDELLSLDLDQIDRDNRRFQVLGKGNKQRWCFYSPDAAKVLQRYLRYYRHKEHPALFTARHPTTAEVTRASYDTIYEDWVKARAQHPALKGIRLHDLRHTFGTERGGLMGVEELRALMGHSSIQTTLLYQKITSSRAEQVAHKALQALTATAEESDSELL